MNISDNHNLTARLLTVAFLLVFLQTIYAQDLFSTTPPKHETRAVWLTTLNGLDWPSAPAVTPDGVERQKRELSDILDRLQGVNVNTVLFQTRIRGTVIYPSAIEPWDGCLTGTAGRNPGYDPLAFAIDECHRRGMEIQAWVVALPLGRWDSPGCKMLRAKRPGLVWRHRGQGYINPAAPGAAQYVAALCSEIVSHYDVDGIHLDYIRYPETWHGRDEAQARRNVTQIVEAVHNGIKSLKPWVKLSCAVIGKRADLSRTSSYGWNAYDAGRQDVIAWTARGIVDQLYPMMYFRGGQFYPFLIDWTESVHGCEIVPGLGIYMLAPDEGGWPAGEIERQMSVARSLGMGFALFREKFLKGWGQPIYTYMKDFCPLPSFVAPLPGTTPAAPQSIAVKRAGEYAVISWHGVALPGASYNVYASKTYPVDVTDVRNLVAAKTDSCTVAVKTSDETHFAVTTIDRYGRESSPSQQQTELWNAQVNDCMPLVETVCGNDAALPQTSRDKIEGAVVIRDLAGTDVSIRPCTNGTFATRGLQPGFYAVYSLNRKGITHRLCFMKLTPAQL